ncbi:zf-HC2 domain-containing protein [candidate division WOR-3 bacterium]|nr:zf-HC2 domain-containing protein [candidate division WOR-3 bacterium]
MEHEKIIDMIGAFIDKELNIEDSYIVREHLKMCGECRQYYEEMKSIDTKIGKVADSEIMPSDSYFKSLSSAIMTQLPRKPGFEWGQLFSFMSRREMSAVGIMGFVLIFAIIFRLMFVNTYRDIQNKKTQTAVETENLQRQATTHRSVFALNQSDEENETAITGNAKDSTGYYAADCLISRTAYGGISTEIQESGVDLVGTVSSTTPDYQDQDFLFPASALKVAGACSEIDENAGLSSDGTEDAIPLDRSLTQEIECSSQPSVACEETASGEGFFELTTLDDVRKEHPELTGSVKIRFDIDSGGRVFRIEMPEKLDTALRDYVFNSNYLRKTGYSDTFIEIEITPEKIYDLEFDF